MNALSARRFFLRNSTQCASSAGTAYFLAVYSVVMTVSGPICTSSEYRNLRGGHSHRGGAQLPLNPSGGQGPATPARQPEGALRNLLEWAPGSTPWLGTWRGSTPCHAQVSAVQCPSAAPPRLSPWPLLVSGRTHRQPGPAWRRHSVHHTERGPKLGLVEKAQVAGVWPSTGQALRPAAPQKTRAQDALRLSLTKPKVRGNRHGKQGLAHRAGGRLCQETQDTSSVPTAGPLGTRTCSQHNPHCQRCSPHVPGDRVATHTCSGT